MANGEIILDIDSFLGIDQSADAAHKDIRTSPDMSNFIIERGKMMSAPGATKWAPDFPAGNDDQTTILEAAYHRTDGTTEFRIIAGAGGNLYKLADGAWVQVGSGYKSNAWDAINYRKNTEEWHIITNGADPIQYSAANDETYQALEGAPVLAKYITLSDERLWIGGIPDEQEGVYWSWDNDPNNWEVDLEHPEQGGGFLHIRSHDGTRIVGVKTLLNDVVIFKDRSLHRIVGSYPGEYELVEVYGSTGPISENTIVSSGASVYFLCAEGLCVYNGMTVQTLALSSGDNRLVGLAERINRAAAQRACSAIMKGVMYIALPLDGSELNNAVIVFDMITGIYTLIENYRADSWLVHHEAGGEKLLFSRGASVMVMDGDTDDGKRVDAHWLSPWFESGTKSAKKTSGRVYMSIEARSLTEELPQIRLTMQSEKKKREKIITIKKEGLNIIRPRVKIRGRLLRMGIETVDGARVTIHQGIQIKIESDED